MESEAAKEKDHEANLGLVDRDDDVLELREALDNISALIIALRRQLFQVFEQERVFTIIEQTRERREASE